MALKHSYTLIAPFYDTLVSAPFDAYRIKSLLRLKDTRNKKILINGIGSGLDIPHLPINASYIGTDITPAMLQRAKNRAAHNTSNPPLDIHFQLADSQVLPFENEHFDAIIMHLILAVVPKPELALQEACRVLKPGGRIYIFDKFLKPGQLAIVRRLLNIIARHIATRTDVVFEKVLNTCPQLKTIHNKPAFAKGWFRFIELEKL